MNPTPNGQEGLSSPQGSTPRKRLPLALGILALIAVVAVFIILSWLPRSTGTKTVAPPQQDAETHPEQVLTEAFSSSSSAETAQQMADPRAAEQPSGALPEGEHLESIQVPVQVTQTDLDGLALPPYPYSIYMGGYKEREEAETALREHLSRSLPAYIVPVLVEGSIAQSLFGVTQDGLWYRVLVGQYSSIEPARETLKLVMKELSSYQPEIIKFGYALECGRFLELEDANQLSARMASQALFPYLQTYPTSDGRRLHRILVGCFFSRQGALPLKSELELKGYSCRIAQR